ncbi:MAG: DUF1772 domain-containing protein [Alphaproteobacteria bacterium]|nr:DUF1772 domain-containing protein [Alphaproteobacteria bacterium]
MDGFLCVVTFLAALGSALIAGIFFAFSAILIPALSRLAPASGIAAMQSILVTIKRGPFVLVFFVTALLAVLLGIAAPFRWAEPDALYLLAGSLLYLNGPFGVTLLRNMPLNNRLAHVKPDGETGAKVWKDYLPAWSWWNHVRVATALAAAACLIMALVRQAA